MAVVTVRVDAVQRRLSRLQKKFEEEGSLTVNEVGELGKSYAQSIAPRDTGIMVSMIKWFRPQGDQPNGVIRALNPINSYPGEPKRRNIADFNLVRWAHTSPNANRHFRTGDRQFMYRTTSYLRQRAPNIARGRFDKAVIQTR
jgi:hypothetical protein